MLKVPHKGSFSLAPECAYACTQLLGAGKLFALPQVDYWPDTPKEKKQGPAPSVNPANPVK